MINVIDSVMGSGKTEWSIEYMNSNADKKFMYITPYNKEIKERIIPRCTALNFKMGEQGKKTRDFKESLARWDNIVGTHEVFKRIDKEAMGFIEDGGYTLILDEALCCCETINGICSTDIKTILEKHATIGEHNRLVWHDDNYEDEGGAFSYVKAQAKQNRVAIYGDDKLILWLFPIEVFECFDEVYIMTYLFAGNQFKHYFDIFGIQCKYFKISNKELVEHDGSIANNFASLINIYEGSLNDIGKRKTSLSSGWYERNKAPAKQMAKNVRNYFIGMAKTSSDESLWTCFKKAELKPNGYIKGFLACNARATNAYADRTAVAYTINCFMNPLIRNTFFGKQGISVCDDMYALGEMLQFIWRSAVRNGQPINVYIPSERMRMLLRKYLNNEIDYKSIM